DHCADDRTDEAGAFAGRVPADLLAEPGGNERADDAQNGGEDETARFVLAGRNQLGDDTGNEADDDGPDDAQGCRSWLPSTNNGQRCAGVPAATSAYLRAGLAEKP